MKCFNLTCIPSYVAIKGTLVYLCTRLLTSVICYQTGDWGGGWEALPLSHWALDHIKMWSGTMLRWLIGIILGEIICESSNWQHIQRLKITILGANWQLFKLERIAKCSYFILSTENIKFYWFVMKIKKFMLPIWWYNRGWFPLGNRYLGSLFWMGYWR